MNAKQRAAEAALPLVQSGMVVGLGTGSTADYFLLALGRAVKEGALKNIVGVATSVQSENRAKEVGIPLSTLVETPVLDITVDGADEVDPQLDLIKGLGGALVREKIIAQATKRFVIIADESKIVNKLGTKAPLPVEVLPFVHEAHIPFFKSLGATPSLRTVNGQPFKTDNGNLIYDCKFASIDHALETEQKILARAGVVGTGLFVGMATDVFVAHADQVEHRSRKR